MKRQITLACWLHELKVRLEIHPDILTELGKLAEAARNPKQICLLFGLAGHPAVSLLIAGGRHTSNLFTPTVRLFYRTGVTMMSQDMTMKRKAQADLQKLEANLSKEVLRLDGVDDSVASYHSMMNALQAEHLQGILETGSVLTLPQVSGGMSIVLLHSLDDMVGRVGGGLQYLSLTCQTQRKAQTLKSKWTMVVVLISRWRVAADVAESPEDEDTICLQVVDTTPDSAHVVKTCPAFARRLPPNSFVVAVHDSCRLGGTQLMKGSAHMFGQAGCFLVLLSGLKGDHRELAAGTTSWQAGAKEYTMKGLPLSVAVAKAVTCCVRAGAWPSANPKVLFVQNAESERGLIESLELLVEHQCAICVKRGASGGEWQLATKGKSCVEECTAMLQPSLCFEVHNAIEDRTRYELAAVLDREGCTWCELPSLRDRDAFIILLFKTCCGDERNYKP